MSESKPLEILAQKGQHGHLDNLDGARLRAIASAKNMQRAVDEGLVEASDVAFWGAQQAQAEAAIAQAYEIRQLSVKVGAIGRELAIIRGCLQLQVAPQLEALARDLGGLWHCLDERIRPELDGIKGEIRQAGLDEDLAASQLRVILNEALSQIIQQLELTGRQEASQAQALVDIEALLESHLPGLQGAELALVTMAGLIEAEDSPPGLAEALKDISGKLGYSNAMDKPTGEQLALVAQRLGEIAQHTDPQRGEALADSYNLAGLAEALGAEGQPVRALWALRADLAKIVGHLASIDGTMVESG